MTMLVVNMIAVLLSVVLLLTMLWGFRASLGFKSSLAGRYLSWALVLLTIKYIARGLIWDVLQPTLRLYEATEAVKWLSAHRGYINLVITIIVVVAAICAHLSLYWSIDYTERPHWKKWNAWLYPGRRRKNHG